MKKTSTVFLTLIVIGGFLATFSCKKAKLNKQTTTTEDNAMAEGMFNDVFKVTTDAASEDSSFDGTEKRANIEHMYGSCATVSFDPPLSDTSAPKFPRTMTVDFGSVYCEGNDGKERKGKLIAVFTGRYRDKGTEISISTQNYFVDGYQIEGTRTVTNNGQNSNGNTTFTIVVDGTVTTPDGEDITWNSNRIREWIEGEGTGWWFTIDNNGDTTIQWVGLNGIIDDVYEITGDGSGVNREGRNFTADITTPLRVEFCSYIPEITEGVIEIQPEDLKLRTVDYGTAGSCDNTATVTIGKKKTKDITLTKK